MNINFDELGKKLHAKLDRGLEQFKSAKDHLRDFQKESEAAIQTKIKAAKEVLEEKKKEATAAKERLEEFAEDKKAETQAAAAEWKTNRDRK